MTDGYQKSTSAMPRKDKRARLDVILDSTRRFVETVGRRPRILMARTGEAGSDREMKGVSVALADMGFDVDILGQLRSPEIAAGTAVENDVHLIGVVGIGAGQNRLLIDLTRALAAYEGQEILVTGWRRLPSGDRGAGIDTHPERVVLFHPHDSLTRVAERMLDMLKTRLKF